MQNENTFRYLYSAKENQEVLNIRKKYLPRQETQLESLCAGMGGMLIFGLGMCLAMEVVGHLVWLGILLGLAGVVGMLAAFPVHRKLFNRAKTKYAPRILQLTAELTGEN